MFGNVRSLVALHTHVGIRGIPRYLVDQNMNEMTGLFFVFFVCGCVFVVRFWGGADRPKHIFWPTLHSLSLDMFIISGLDQIIMVIDSPKGDHRQCIVGAQERATMGGIPRGPATGTEAVRAGGNGDGRGCTGEFSKKKIFSKIFSSQYNVVDMVCHMTIHHERF